MRDRGTYPLEEVVLTSLIYFDFYLAIEIFRDIAIHPNRGLLAFAWRTRARLIELIIK